MDTVVCTRCGTEYPATLEFFAAYSTKRNGLKSWCRHCDTKNTAEWRRKNRDKARILDERQRIRHREDRLAWARAYRVANRDKVNCINREWAAKNPDRVKEHKRNGYLKKRELPKYRISINVSRQVRRAIEGRKAGRHWEDLVGYTLNDLMAHLESQFAEGMSWGNYGKWHIDHIRPIASFEFGLPEDAEFKECWALENLQPLWAVDNLSKGAKYEQELVLARS